MDLFGVGGGALVSESLSRNLGTEVPLMGRVPFDVRLREGGDAGVPLVAADPQSPAGFAIIEIADLLAEKPRGLAGMSLGLTPARRK
jgi:ATP-binding protein involved in chromosome partitioning